MNSDDARDRIAIAARAVMDTIKELRQLKAEFPEHSSSFYEGNAGSILNAYREGDLSFDEAVTELGGVKRGPHNRKIIQISCCQIENTMSTQCQMMIMALCDDGTLWSTDNCRMYEGCELQPWHQIRPIPQIDTSAELP